MSADAFTGADLGPAVEAQIVKDMLRRTWPILPAVVLLVAVLAGANGAISVGYAMALVVVNFVLAAIMLTYAGRISFAALGAAALFGYLLRLGLLTVAVLAVRNASWFRPIPLGITIIVTHLALLIWEMRYISASLAFPGLKPEKAKASNVAKMSLSKPKPSNRAHAGAEE
jgi:hypothetical protein